MLPNVPSVENRLVDEAVVAKKLVEVALLEVALSAVKFCSVDEPVTKRLVVEAKVKSAEVAERSAVLGLKVKAAVPVTAAAPVK